MTMRPLSATEIAVARRVFSGSIPYERVFISDFNLGGAVTLAGVNVRDGRFIYRICWPDAFRTALATPSMTATFIHEMTHVWQGENGVWPTFYMGQSVWAQLRHGVEDIVAKGEWRGWDRHRGTAYIFSASDIGQPWNRFNVEQQASLVQSWFIAERDRSRRDGHTHFGPGIHGGGESPHDARFPYIRDVIRGRNRNAPYRAPSLPPGGDPQIKAIQDRLVSLGYLDARHADGLVGRGRSATLDAVLAFQRRNGLRPDRDLGGPNSETRRKLAQPPSTLVRAQ